MDELTSMSEAQFKDLITKGNVAELYSDNDIIRALIQMVPSVGPLLDVVLARPGTKQKEERLQTLLLMIYRSIKFLQQQIGSEDFNRKLKWTNSDEFYDMLLSAIESSVRTRSREKIILNAMILTNILSVENDGSFRPEEYLYSLEQLSPVEIRILLIYYQAYQSTEPNSIFVNELMKARELDAQGKIVIELGIDFEDVEFLLKRLERSGFIKEIVSVIAGYDGGMYTVTKSFMRMMDYLSRSPFKSLII